PGLESPAAAAEDARNPRGLARGRGGAPTRAGRVGGPALGRSLDTGAAGSAPGADARGAAVRSTDVSPGVSPAVGAPLLSDPAYAQPPDTPASRRDGPAHHGWQDAAGRGGAADGGQDRRGAAVCRRTHQDGVRVGAPPRG